METVNICEPKLICRIASNDNVTDCQSIEEEVQNLRTNERQLLCRLNSIEEKDQRYAICAEQSTVTSYV